MVFLGSQGSQGKPRKPGSQDGGSERVSFSLSLEAHGFQESQASRGSQGSQESQASRGSQGSLEGLYGVFGKPRKPGEAKEAKEAKMEGERESPFLSLSLEAQEGQESQAFAQIPCKERTNRAEICRICDRIRGPSL